MDFNFLLLLASLLALFIAAILLLYFIYSRSKYIYYFHYKSNSFITGTIILLYLSLIFYILIEATPDVFYNIHTATLTGIIASGFLFMLTYIQTQKEEKHNLKLLLKKIAICNFLAQKMEERLYDIKRKEELNEKITLFKQEVFTAYQIASACKVSFIPVIAVADSFIQKLETTDLHNVTRNFFIELNALHDFLSPASWTTEKISCMPEYEDIDKIKKIYKELYDKISCSSLPFSDRQHTVSP